LNIVKKYMAQNCNRTIFAIVHLNLPRQMGDRKIHGRLEAERWPRQSEATLRKVDWPEESQSSGDRNGLTHTRVKGALPCSKNKTI
jgi:hypothetical protein